MEFRKLGRTNLDVSFIGLGAEHIENSRGTKDRILSAAVDSGVNYIDLLYIEPEYWENFRPILRPYRNKLVLAVHWGSGPRYDFSYCKDTFDNILSHLENGYIEVAMMTMIDEKERWGSWVPESLKYLRLV